MAPQKQKPARECWSEQPLTFPQISVGDVRLDAVVPTKIASGIVALAPHTLENLRVVGGGPKFLKYGPAGGRGTVRYRIRDLLAWRDANECKSTADC